MATLLSKNSTAKLPSSVRQRLTFQYALLSNPTQYLNKKTKKKRRVKEDKVIKERVSPKPSVVHDTTQTKDVLDAETNTKMPRGSMIETQKYKLKRKCATTWKGAILATSPYLEIVRRLKQDSDYKQKKSFKDSVEGQPDIKRRRGILKKVVEDLTLEGMSSTGTTTKTQPIFNKNTLFLKYSKSWKKKKKRVRMDNKPALSYFTKRDQESVQSFNDTNNQNSKQMLQASGVVRPKRVSMADDNDYASDHSEDDASLERTPARLALRASRTARRGSDAVLDAASDGSTASSITNMSSVPQLRVCAKTMKFPKRPPCRVPKDRLYFKNMFNIPVTLIRQG